MTRPALAAAARPGRLAALAACLAVPLACARPEPQGLRLVERLAGALETPAPPPQRVLLAQEVLPRDATVRFAVEPERPFVLRLRLRAGAHARLRALPGGAVLGPCLPADAPEEGAQGPRLCQRYDVLKASETEVEVQVDGEASRLLALDASEPDRRAPRSPWLAPLLRHAWGLADTGRSWRTALVAPPGGRYVFDLPVAEGAELWVGLGHEPGARAAPVRFVARQDGRTLLDETTPPDHRWRDRRLPLLAAAHSRIELWSTAASPDGRGLWADPRVLRAAPGAPSVVLVTIDAMNPSHLGAYGYARDTSPALDRIARAGARFDRATAQAGTTWVSIPSLLSGLYPGRDGVRARGEPLPAEVRLLSDLLAARGYDTFAGSDLAVFPTTFLSGFDRADAIEVPPDTPEADANRAATERLAAQIDKLAPQLAGHASFAWLHLEQAHYPLRPTEPLRYDPGYTGRFARAFTVDDRLLPLASISDREGAHVRALYDASVRDADAVLRHLVVALDAAGALDRTLLVITADHGEHVVDTRKLLEHASPYDAVLHVPLIFAGPGVRAGGVVPGRVQLVDVVPTVLSLLGAAVPPGLDGRDLSRALRDGAPRGEALADAPAFAQVNDSVAAMYRGDEQLVQTGAQLELYDLAVDPAELHDLAALEPARLRAAAAALEDERQRWRRSALDTSAAPLGQEALEGLRAAGYLQDDARDAGVERPARR